MDKSEIAYAFAWYFIFLISVTVHEAAHAWASNEGGDPTAYAGGQVSLNPWPHIKRAPLGMVVIPIISIFLIHWPFGFAVTPYDPVWAFKNPRKAGWMAAAGPIANFGLLLIAYLVIILGLKAGFFLQPVSMNFHHLVDPSTGGILNGLAVFMSMLFSMNLILFILNIIPLPPLDGSGIISIFLQEDSARKYKAIIGNPVFGLIGLLFVWWVFTPVFQTIFLKVMSLIYWGQSFYYTGASLISFVSRFFG
jgi:Zn-dependent protease